MVGLSGITSVVNLLSHRGVKPIWNERLQAFLGKQQKTATPLCCDLPYDDIPFFHQQKSC